MPAKIAPPAPKSTPKPAQPRNQHRAQAPRYLHGPSSFRSQTGPGSDPVALLPSPPSARFRHPSLQHSLRSRAGPANETSPATKPETTPKPAPPSALPESPGIRPQHAGPAQQESETGSHHLPPQNLTTYPCSDNVIDYAHIKQILFPSDNEICMITVNASMEMHKSSEMKM